MPSPFAHMAAGYIVYRFFKRRTPKSIRLWIIPGQLAAFAGLSLLPDLDALPGIILGDFGRFHNNFTHSLTMGLVVALVFASLVSWMSKVSWNAWFSAALICYELHVIMDMFTGDRGVMLLWPFTSTRFTAPLKLFAGVQWGHGFLSAWHLWTLFTEGLFFAIVLLIINRLYKNRPAQLGQSQER